MHFTPLNNIIDLFKSYKKFIDRLKNISLRAKLSPNNFQNKPTQGSQKKKRKKKKPKPILTTSLGEHPHTLDITIYNTQDTQKIKGKKKTKQNLGKT